MYILKTDSEKIVESRVTNHYVLQGILIVTLYSYLSILVGKISTVFLQILEYLLTDQGFESPSQS